jgi:hypothetical protein
VNPKNSLHQSSVTPRLSRWRAKRLIEEGKRQRVDVREIAKANDECGTRFSQFGCDRHDRIQIINRHLVNKCKNRFSKCCASHVEKQRIRKRSHLIRSLERADLHRTYHLYLVNVDVPSKRTAESIENFHKKLRCMVDEILERAMWENEEEIGARTGYFWQAAINGFRQNRVVGSAIMMSEINPIKLQAIRIAVNQTFGPEAQLRVTDIISELQVEDAFTQLLKIIVPEDEEDQAQLEVAFHLIAMTSYGEEKCEKQFSVDSWHCMLDAPEPPGVVLPTEVDSDEVYDQTQMEEWFEDVTCPKCGRVANVISEPHIVGASRWVVRNGEWRPLFGGW